MKIVVFGDSHRVGALRDGTIVDLAEASGGSVPAKLRAFIVAGDAALDAAQVALERGLSTGQGAHDAASVRLHAPLVRGARVACAGGNYADHAAAMARNRGVTIGDGTIAAIAAELRSRGIWGFWKIVEPADPHADISYPARAQRFDYEGECAIVLGQPVRDARADGWRSRIWGVTLLCDWSIRDVIESGPAARFSLEKNFDGGFSFGPAIVVGEDLDPAAIDVATLVNGEPRQQYNTRDMVFSFGEYLEYLSRDLTFQPGDVLSGGTAAGTAADSSVKHDGIFPPDRFLKVGDSVEVRSPQVGSLSARIVAKPAAVPVGAF